MSTRKTLLWIVGLMLVASLAGCAPPGPNPKAGHWEGSKPSVSFTLTPDRKLRDFTIKVSMGADTCTIATKQDQEIAVEVNGAFLIGTKSSDGKLDMNGISGQFVNPTTLKGRYSGTILCGAKMSFNILGERDWTAEWKAP